MSIVRALLGEGVAAPVEAIGNVLGKVYTRDGERLTHEEVMARIGTAPQLAQAEISKVEAQHRTLFVAGARPFILWVCGVGIAYGFVVRDLLAWGLRVWAPEAEPPPELALEHLMALVTAVLGLGGYRTVEKLRGRAR